MSDAFAPGLEPFKGRPNLKTFATVEEIGSLAVYLASDLAASTTGTAIPVDGGWVAH